MVSDDSLQNLQRLSQHLLTFALFPTQQFSDPFVCFIGVVVEFNCSVVAFQCLFEPTETKKCKTHVIMSICISGVEFEGCFDAVDPLILLSEFLERHTEVIMNNCIIGVDFEGYLIFVDRLIVSVDIIKCHTEVIMNNRIFGVMFKGGVETVDRLIVFAEVI